jgi:hypothetical protein
MSDVVVRLPVREGEEAQLFGDYLSRFLASQGQEAELWAANSDAPYVMIHSDPLADVEMKVITFQERGAAAAFSRGWAEARTGLAGSS